MFAILDSKSSEQVDAVTVNAVVQQLRDAVSRATDGPAGYVRLSLSLSVCPPSLWSHLFSGAGHETMRG